MHCDPKSSISRGRYLRRVHADAIVARSRPMARFTACNHWQHCHDTAAEAHNGGDMAMLPMIARSEMRHDAAARGNRIGPHTTQAASLPNSAKAERTPNCCHHSGHGASQTHARLPSASLQSASALEHALRLVSCSILKTLAVNMRL